ncbi:MAG: hypothetical protein KJN63_03830, partial [Acidimicrobiia bacterium]|nr:hypothetical protein [Acidimicrobiia bacterium]
GRRMPTFRSRPAIELTPVIAACLAPTDRQSDHATSAHQLSVASLHGEFCTALSPGQARDLLKADLPDAHRAQGNE